MQSGGGDNLELGGNRTTTNPSLVNDEGVSSGIEFDGNSQDIYFGPTIWIPDRPTTIPQKPSQNTRTTLQISIKDLNSRCIRRLSTIHS